jgi:hypothetical protein
MVNLGHDLYFEGPYNQNLKFPDYLHLQKLAALLASHTPIHILILQRLSIYEGDESKDKLLYLLINERGFPAYFHLVNLDLQNLQSNLFTDIQVLEKKFKTKIYVCEHQNITP